MKTFKLTNVPASAYEQIAQLDCTLLQKAQLVAAVGVQTLVKVPTVILNRAGEFLCSVYDISAEEFVAMGEDIKPNTQEGDVGVLAIGKAALRTPFVVIRHAGKLVYRVVVSAVENLVGVFKDLLGIARDTKATLLCRFNPEAARVLLEQLKDETNNEEVARFMTSCGDEALDSLQDAVLENQFGTEKTKSAVPNVVQAISAHMAALEVKIQGMVDKAAQNVKGSNPEDIAAIVQAEVRKQLVGPMFTAPAKV